MGHNSDGFDPTVLNTSLTFAGFRYIYKWVGGWMGANIRMQKKYESLPTEVTLERER